MLIQIKSDLGPEDGPIRIEIDFTAYGGPLVEMTTGSTIIESDQFTIPANAEVGGKLFALDRPVGGMYYYTIMAITLTQIEKDFSVNIQERGPMRVFQMEIIPTRDNMYR